MLIYVRSNDSNIIKLNDNVYININFKITSCSYVSSVVYKKSQNTESTMKKNNANRNDILGSYYKIIKSKKANKLKLRQYFFPAD